MQGVPTGPHEAVKSRYFLAEFEIKNFNGKNASELKDSEGALRSVGECQGALASAKECQGAPRIVEDARERQGAPGNSNPTIF